MPHRTVFQWGKNHAHPFTMFVGGAVVGSLVTGAIAYYVDNSEFDEDYDDNVVNVKKKSSTSSPSPRVSPSASPTVSF